MGATDIAINMKKKLNKEKGCILLYSEVFLYVYRNIRMAFNKPLISLMSTAWPANISGKGEILSWILKYLKFQEISH